MLNLEYKDAKSDIQSRLNIMLVERYNFLTGKFDAEISYKNANGDECQVELRDDKEYHMFKHDIDFDNKFIKGLEHKGNWSTCKWWFTIPMAKLMYDEITNNIYNPFADFEDSDEYTEQFLNAYRKHC
jgi:hypothetical protein